MTVIGLAGWSGSGKTTLMLGLIATFRRRGVRVSTLKHSHHRVEVDRPDDDSHRLRAAGAAEVLVASSRRFALIHDRDEAEITLEDLLPRFGACDLLLVEGFKRGRHAKLEVFRPELGKPPLYPDDPRVVAVATTAPGPFPLPRFDLGDIEAIADFLAALSCS